MKIEKQEEAEGIFESALAWARFGQDNIFSIYLHDNKHGVFKAVNEAMLGIYEQESTNEDVRESDLARLNS